MMGCPPIAHGNRACACPTFTPIMPSLVATTSALARKSACARTSFAPTDVITAQHGTWTISLSVTSASCQDLLGSQDIDMETQETGLVWMKHRQGLVQSCGDQDN